MKTNPTDFTIGADPEFTCVDGHDNVIAAQDFVDTANGATEFGADGCGITFEVRPAPSKEPLQIVNNIHDIFTRQVITNPEFLKFKWLSGSYKHGFPLGGHVHFGISDRIINHTSTVNLLDTYVGAVSILLETKDEGLLRREDGYGEKGDYRPQNWGFEYRPMSSWLSSPYVAAAILCLSKTVVYEALNNPKFNWNEFFNSSDFAKMNQKKILTKFPKIWEDITKMELYQVYKPYIDLIYFLVKNKLTWVSTAGMKESWGVIDMKPCITNKIGMDIIWHRYNTEYTTI